MTRILAGRGSAAKRERGSAKHKLIARELENAKHKLIARERAQRERNSAKP